MITLFVSSLCPDCPPAIKAFEQSKLNYELVDITASMKNLKRFLKLRDTCPYFDQIKKEGRVGIPLIMLGEAKDFISFQESIDLTKLSK